MMIYHISSEGQIISTQEKKKVMTLPWEDKEVKGMPRLEKKDEFSMVK